MKILTIGNSYSQDATRYINAVARADGDKGFKVVNLYIGGCPLRNHYLNALSDKRAYGIEVNGYQTGFYGSIKEALSSEGWDDWDVVTLQQQSSRSADYSTFSPYIEYLADYVRKYSPSSKLYLHQTWGYRPGSAALLREGYSSHSEMFSKVRSSYEKAAKAVNAAGVIPSGAACEMLVSEIGERAFRDDIHMSLGTGRLMLGLLWYGYLTGRDIENINMTDTDEPVSAEEYKAAMECAKKAIGSYNKEKKGR